MDTVEALVTMWVVGVVVGVPMMAISIRFALKPAIEAWAKAREVRGHVPTSATELEALKLRVAALEVVWEQRLGAGTLKPSSRELQLVD